MPFLARQLEAGMDQTKALHTLDDNAGFGLPSSPSPKPSWIA